MHQIGTVIEVFKNNKAKILMRKHSACGDCGACQHGKENMQMHIIAFNEAGAKVGDTVEVDMETQSVLGAAFVVYVVPLLMLLIGIGGGHYFLKQIENIYNTEVYVVAIGFVLMALSFAIIKMHERTLQNDRKYIPTISRVLSKE